jgi:hypothetical protein
MMKITAKQQKMIRGYLRSIVYSLTVVLGLSIAFNLLDRGHEEDFLKMVVITSCIFVIEIYTGWLFRRQQIDQLEIPLFGHRLFSELTHHLLIPLFMFWSISGFGYFNRQPHLRTAILAFAFVVLAIMFANIRAFYENRKKLEQQTHYIYDIAKLLLFFGASDSFFYVTQSVNLPELAALAVAGIGLLLLVMMSIRHERLDKRIGIQIIILTIILFIVSLISIRMISNPLQLSTTVTLVYYLITATIHHLLNKDFDLGVALEYVLITLLALGFIYGLT